MIRSIYILLIVLALLFIYLISLPPVRENFLIDTLKEKLATLDPDFAKLDIREASSSYTEDKSVIYLCLRDESGNFYPINTLMYVVLHEISHLLNKKDYGHTEAFHKIFDKLLCKAAAIGLYDPNLPHPSNYCNVNISGITMPSCNIEDL